ncbi:MAG TPA: hypothetical protein VKV57_11835 [bacterium]|nr:hypothetical protein [bacterium]
MSTDDAQATVIFPQNGVVPHHGESSVIVKITPVDPFTFAPPPSQLNFDGNAYRIDLRYANSKAVIELAKPVTVVLRYPISATALLRFSGSGWSPLGATQVSEGMEVFAPSDLPGVFVAAGPTATRPWIRWLVAIVVIAGIGAVARRIFSAGRHGGIGGPGATDPGKDEISSVI